MWCRFALHLLKRQAPGKERLIYSIMGFGVLICALMIIFDSFISAHLSSRRDILLPYITGELASRLGFSVYGVLLAENIYRNTAPDFRWHVKLLCVALAIIFGYGVVLYGDALLFRRISPLLWDGRAIAFAIATPLLAVSAARNRDWAIDIQVSRTAVFHTATLIGSGIFLLSLALTGEVLRRFGPGWGDLAEVALVLTGLTGLAVIATSGSARSRLRRFVSENFYTFRY